MAPRRREESARIDDRRVTELPTQPNLKLVVPETDGRADGRRRPHDRHIRRYRTTAVLVDVAAASVGAVVAQIGRFGIAPNDRALAYWWGSLALPILWVLAVLISRAYENRFLASSAEEYRRVINAAVGLIAGIAVVSYLLKTEFARGYVVLALPICMAISLLGRYTARRRLRRARQQGKYLQDVLVVGHEWAVLDLVAELRRNPDSGLNVVGACVPGGRGSRQMADMEVPVIGDLNQVVESVKRVGADVLAVTTCVEFGGPELRRVCWALENSDVEIVVAPALIEVAGPRLHIRPVAKLPLLHVEKPELTGARRVIKDVFDRSSAFAALLLLAPLMIGVALDDPVDLTGPALFRQTRVGSQGKPFTICKFRSMYVDAEARLDELQAQNERATACCSRSRTTRGSRPIGRVPASLLDRRAAAADQRAEGRHVARRPAPAAARRGRAVRATTSGAGCSSGLGSPGLWQVSGRSDLVVGRIGAARPALRRELVLDLRLRDPVEDVLRSLEGRGCLLKTPISRAEVS